MKLREELEAFWRELEATRAEILKEVEGLSQTHFDWRPAPEDWSIGEVIHHVTIAEIATGKLQTKLLRQAEGAGILRPSVPGVPVLEPLPRRPGEGPAQAPAHIWPERGRPAPELLDEMRAARERTRKNFERFAAVDPRPLVSTHLILGPMHLGQYWTLVLAHDRIHVPQIRAVKAAPGFPER